MDVRVGLLLAALVFAGCLSEDSPPSAFAGEPVAAVAEPDLATLTLAESALPATETGGDEALPVLSAGRLLRWTTTCPCPALAFELAGEAAWDGWLDVRVQWDGTQAANIGVTLEGSGGNASGERGFDDRLARLWNPQPGAHRILLDGAGDVTVTARLGTLRLPTMGALLPNLVELVIEGPRIGTCDEVEQTEQGATKCMRFGNGVGNPGHGPVQIRLTVDEGVMALGTLDGRFAQEVRQTDGSISSHAVGPAEFHVSHTHWHYDGLAVFDLYAVDPSTGLRGALATSHHKAGFCFLDWGEMEEPVTSPAAQERAESDCLIPGTTGSWTNGISRGWYDFYWSDLTDQYVDVAGLPDGVYELVASADPLGTLDELDETDNQSSVLLRLAGDDVEVLEERAHYRVQEKDDE